MSVVVFVWLDWWALLCVRNRGIYGFDRQCEELGVKAGVIGWYSEGAGMEGGDWTV